MVAGADIAPFSVTSGERRHRGCRVRDTRRVITQSRRHDAALLVVVVAILVVVNVVAHRVGGPVEIALIPVAAVVLLAVARGGGLGWRDLGLSRSELRAGIPFAVASVIVVAAIVSAAVAIPATREFFLSDRYDDTSEALLAAFVIIPLQTVLPEEVIFRGVLQGVLGRLCRPVMTLIFGAVAFGLWHISSSTGLTAGNEGLSDVLGAGVLAQIAGIAGAVLATGVAGFVLGWLRHRTTSLLAPIALHWALNATGAIGAAVAWQVS
ncbi:CPBP family intramembrane metalloprotease [Gordonia jinghuaiqii]|uniref:CPBP family intramembrane metalloprotease n=1 Tax=Gordonia jinghuaiqii TaxID=2758710 RepID=A0A7D7LSW1_9ACTN|nr:CPBP family intramembrane metalloprotease [Gordonia jinghuaiqii]QMS99914.1 CPBP family intramembrane metalloprotease [Gordonia jinghuaiqii]